MITRIRSLIGVAAFAFALTRVPAGGLPFPFLTPATPAPQVAVHDSNPLRSLLNLVAQESANLWPAVERLYSDTFVATACDQSC